MTTEKELGKALKNERETIEIEGDLAKKVIKIKATGNVSWGVCIAGITVAVSLTVVNIGSAGVATPIAGPALVASLAPVTATTTATLGLPTALAATGIAIAGGGVGALNRLRKYRLEKISNTKVILHKR